MVYFLSLKDYSCSLQWRPLNGLGIYVVLVGGWGGRDRTAILLSLFLCVSFSVSLSQPEGLVAGLGDAYRCVSRGFSSAEEVLRRLYTPSSIGTEMFQIAGRVLPALILRPLLGFSEGCTRAAQVCFESNPCLYYYYCYYYYYYLSFSMLCDSVAGVPSPSFKFVISQVDVV